MNIGDLREKLNFLSERKDQLSATYYFLVKNGDRHSILLADIKHEAQVELCNKQVEKFSDFLTNEKLTVQDLSSTDARKNTILKYDLEETNTNIDELFLSVDEDTPKFSFADNNLNDIFGILTVIAIDSFSVRLFKKNFPMNYISKDKVFGLKQLGNNNRFVKMDSDFLRIQTDSDFFILDDILYIINSKVLDKNFKIKNILRNEASKSLEKIESFEILESIDSLKEEIGKEDFTFIRKLVKISNSSPVFDAVEKADLINFTKENDRYKEKFEYNSSGDKIILKTKKMKNLLLKLLNEDYLTSDLTHLTYDVMAKDKIEE